jgi:hypothetical protein
MSLEVGTYINDLVATNPVGATDDASQGDDHIRLIKNVLRNSFPNITKATYLQQARSDVASASETDIGAVSSDYVRITGTTTITSLGTAPAGTQRWVVFQGALTLTHGSNLLLPGAANITTAANDRMFAISSGSGTWVVLFYTRASGLAVAQPAPTRTVRTVSGTSCTLELADNGNVVRRTNGTNNIVTIPPNSSVPFPVETQIDLLCRGAGEMVITPDLGVTLVSFENRNTLAGNGAAATLVKEDTDIWHLFGNII